MQICTADYQIHSSQGNGERIEEVATWRASFDAGSSLQADPEVADPEKYRFTVRYSLARGRTDVISLLRGNGRKDGRFTSRRQTFGWFPLTLVPLSP